MTPATLKVRAIACSALLGGLIVLSCFLFAIVGYWLPARFPVAKDVFQMAVQNTLEPMFTATITGTLAYIFGDKVTAAIAARIKKLPQEDTEEI